MGLPPIARRLGQPCDAWLAEVAHHVLVNELTVHLCVMEHVWTGAHHAHVAFEHIKELRELIDVRAPHEIAKRKLPGIVLCCLNRIGILVDVHGTKLIAHEGVAVISRAGLLKEYRSWRLALYEESYDGDEGQQAQAHNQAEREIKRTLEKFVEWIGQGLTMIREHQVIIHSE